MIPSFMASRSGLESLLQRMFSFELDTTISGLIHSSSQRVLVGVESLLNTYFVTTILPHLSVTKKDLSKLRLQY